MIEKKTVIDQLKANIQKELDAAKQAYDTSHKHATDQDLKADGKYDTRSIEAGYLAGAQMKRVNELEEEFKLIEEVNIDHKPDMVSVGSLISLRHNGQERFYFISSTSGGTMINVEGQVVLIISAFSPIGTEVLSLKAGESFEVEVAGKTREYDLIGIW